MHNPAESGLGETGRELHHHGLQQQAEAEGWSQEQSSRLRGKVALAPIWLQCSGVHGGVPCGFKDLILPVCRKVLLTLTLPHVAGSYPRGEDPGNQVFISRDDSDYCFK